MGANAVTGTGRIAAVGTFDGVHLGHQMMIRQVCDLAERHSLEPAIFTFEQHPLSVIAPERAPRMLTTPDQRSQLIIGYGARQVVILKFDQRMRRLTAEQFLTMLRGDYAVEMLVIGFNHRFGHNSAGSFDEYRRIGESIGMTLIKASEYTDPSVDMPINSSSIRRLVAEGNIHEATRLLGHYFAIRGTVVHGHGIGSGIGYPTANIEPYMADQQLPLPGVYAAMALLADGSRHPAMVNIGTNPTIGIPGQTQTIEANIIGFDSDIYGQPIEISFISRLRDECRFDSIADLTAQLAKDRDETIKQTTEDRGQNTEYRIQIINNNLHPH